MVRTRVDCCAHGVVGTARSQYFRFLRVAFCVDIVSSHRNWSGLAARSTSCLSRQLRNDRTATGIYVRCPGTHEKKTRRFARREKVFRMKRTERSTISGANWRLANCKCQEVIMLRSVFRWPRAEVDDVFGRFENKASCMSAPRYAGSRQLITAVSACLRFHALIGS